MYYLVALFGALFGFIASSRWGGTKSFIGRAFIAFSIGLACQCFGQLTYNYYSNHLNIQIPYPSIGDIGYFGSVMFYIYGTLMLVKISKEKFSINYIFHKIYIILIPIVMLILSYVLFLQSYIFDWSNFIKIFLDFGYPLGESIFIFIALLAFSHLKKKFGGAMRLPIIFFIFSLIFQFFSDFVFLYQANNGTWFAGSINEVMYLISYILMAFSLILFSIWPLILPD
jgi:hypothetical protein